MNKTPIWSSKSLLKLPSGKGEWCSSMPIIKWKTQSDWLFFFSKEISLADTEYLPMYSWQFVHLCYDIYIYIYISMNSLSITTFGWFIVIVSVANPIKWRFSIESQHLFLLVLFVSVVSGYIRTYNMLYLYLNISIVQYTREGRYIAARLNWIIIPAWISCAHVTSL